MKCTWILIILPVIVWALPQHWVSSNHLSVGDEVQYVLELPPDVSYTLKDTFKGFEIVNSMMDARPTANVYTYTLQLFSVDDVVIPSLNIGEFVVLGDIPIMIQSSLSPTMNQLHDIAAIKDIVYIPWAWILSIGLSLGLLAIFVWWWMKRKKNLAMAIELAKTPPVEVALTALKQLERAVNDDAYQVKQGYFQLTEIMCRYITEVTPYDILDATTLEMRRLLLKKKEIKQAPKIIKLAETMDFYKFSPNPTFNLNEFQGSLREVKKIVQDVNHDY